MYQASGMSRFLIMALPLPTCVYLGMEIDASIVHDANGGFLNDFTAQSNYIGRIGLLPPNPPPGIPESEIGPSSLGVLSSTQRALCRARSSGES